MVGACGLGGLADHTYLWTQASAQSHALLRHWLGHYMEQGVRLATHASVHLEPSQSDRELELALEALAAHQVRNVTVLERGMNSSGLAARLRNGVNTFLGLLPEDAWLIWADVDEFFTWPCNVAQMLKQTRLSAACGRMSDRLAQGLIGMRKVTHATSLFEQFPVCSTLRRRIGGVATKLTLLRSRINGQVPRS